jgi:hypothetical protein
MKSGIKTFRDCVESNDRSWTSGNVRKNYRKKKNGNKRRPNANNNKKATPGWRNGADNVKL